MKNKKSLGQHWLKNRAILEEIADLAAGSTPVIEELDFGGNEDLLAFSGGTLAGRPLGAPLDAVCVEIGPGLGTLTSSLLKRFRKVVAVEFDADLAAKLPGSFPGKNLEVVNEDILRFDFGRVTGTEAGESGETEKDGTEVKAVEKDRIEVKKTEKDGMGAEKGKKGIKYVVAGNIPYYITSPIIERLLGLEPAPERIVLLIQKEVAERIADEKETMLSLMVKNRAEVALGPVVPRAEFTPPPKVDSQVVVLRPHAPEVDEEVFELIRRGFRAPRKKLVHNLTGLRSEQELKKAFLEVGLDENARPGDLHLEDWAKLYEAIANLA